jgi:uridine kinase
MLTNTSQITLFGLEKYYDGLLLRIPSRDNPNELGEMTRQDKMFEAFRERQRMQELLGIGTLGQFNEAVAKGYARTIINVSEALQEKKIARIADEIASRKECAWCSSQDRHRAERQPHASDCRCNS